MNSSRASKRATATKQVVKLIAILTEVCDIVSSVRPIQELKLIVPWDYLVPNVVGMAPETAAESSFLMDLTDSWRPQYWEH